MPQSSGSGLKPALFIWPSSPTHAAASELPKSSNAAPQETGWLPERQLPNPDRSFSPRSAAKKEYGDPDGYQPTFHQA
ncbi:hypothetical protein [Deinococcus sp. UYEF24]